MQLTFFLCLQTGTCALFFAAQGGFLDIVTLLIDHSVPVDIPSYVSFLISCQYEPGGQVIHME